MGSSKQSSMKIMEPATAERPPDLQETIRSEFGDAVPSEVWEALEAVKPFLEAQNKRPQVKISLNGTGCVRPK